MSEPGSFECRFPCDAGSFHTGPDPHTACPARVACQKAQCTACPENHYSAFDSACVACPAKPGVTVTTPPGSSSCTYSPICNNIPG